MCFIVFHSRVRSSTGCCDHANFRIIKLAEEHNGPLNSATVCSCGFVNERWLVNLHTGARFHVLHFHPRTIPKQYGLMRPHQFFGMWLGSCLIVIQWFFFGGKLVRSLFLEYVRAVSID